MIMGLVEAFALGLKALHHHQLPKGLRVRAPCSSRSPQVRVNDFPIAIAILDTSPSSQVKVGNPTSKVQGSRQGSTASRLK